MINLDPAEISQCRWMRLDEFLQTQNHPLITAVLSWSYGLEGAEGAAACAEGLGAGQPAPLVEMIFSVMRKTLMTIFLVSFQEGALVN